MTDDIPALIEEVQRRIDDDGCGPEWAAGTSLDHRIIEALSRLTALPLPEEIAGLIERLNQIEANNKDSLLWTDKWLGILVREVRVALQRLAREGERLSEGWSAQSVRAEKAEARIAELEAHCVRLGQGGAERYWEGRWRELEAERDAIREEAATCGKMCCLYAEEPDANGQKSMSGCMIDSVAPFLVSIAYPLREMCRHEGLDAQAGVCRQCGIKEEDIAAIRALAQPKADGTSVRD